MFCVTGKVTEQQKTALMEAINAGQEGIEKLRKELVAYSGLLRQMQVSIGCFSCTYAGHKSLAAP